MNKDFKIGTYVWVRDHGENKCYKVLDIIDNYLKLEMGVWKSVVSNTVKWKPIHTNILLPEDKIIEGNNIFSNTRQWKCVYCNTINNGSDVKCQGIWYGNLPYPHTKYGSLPNNQQYFLWGGEKNGVVKFPPSVQLFKYKDWKVDTQKRKLRELYKKGVPCNAIRCTHSSHINKTFKGTPQVIIYPYPNGLSYLPGEMVGHIRTHNETICPRCFNHYPEYQMPINFILYDKHRIRLENERNWWFVEVLFWIKHEILDKNKLLTPSRCESLVFKMHNKIISKISLPEYINTVFTKAPGKSDHTWYDSSTHEISFKKMLDHFVNYLLNASKHKGTILNVQKIIEKRSKHGLKF